MQLELSSEERLNEALECQTADIFLVQISLSQISVNSEKWVHHFWLFQFGGYLVKIVIKEGNQKQLGEKYRKHTSVSQDTCQAPHQRNKRHFTRLPIKSGNISDGVNLGSRVCFQNSFVKNCEQNCFSIKNKSSSSKIRTHNSCCENFYRSCLFIT